MISLGPGKTLMLLCGAAAVILLGGIRLARREQSVRLARDQTGVRQFTDAAQDQLHRLEALYETHLIELTRDTPADAAEMRMAAGRIVGVRLFSVLHPHAESAKDQHVAALTASGGSLPLPTFAPQERTAGNSVRLDEARLLGSEERSGWIEEPGKPLLFFWRRPDRREVVVLTLSSRAIQTAVTPWLRVWAEAALKPLGLGAGTDALRTADGEVLVTSGKLEASPPDQLRLLHNRLGTWELASWDRRMVHTSYDPATLVVAGALGLLFVGLGILLFVQQRQTLRIAAQRVSFVNRVSHELRSPLTNILLNVDLAADSVDDAPEEAARRLNLVQEEAGRLQRLIDNVLTFSQQEERRWVPRPRTCLPDRVVESVLEQFAPSFTRRGLQWRRTGRAEVACLLDADALTQILANLLSNVEKYAAPGAAEVEVKWNSDHLTIRVSDEGPGVPARAAERIFLPFERLDNRVNEGAAGTGLGLTIARELAGRLQGTLRLVPSPRGACFELQVNAPLASRTHDLASPV